MEKEEAIERSKRVIERIKKLPLSKITQSSKSCLLRLVYSELNFLSHLSSSPSSSLSCNVGYIEAIVHILEQPYINGVSRVCKLIRVSSEAYSRETNDALLQAAHVDIVCNFRKNPTWFIVSDRNPKHVCWEDSGRNKGLKVRIEQIVHAARSSEALKPAFLVLFFAHGLGNTVCEKVIKEFGFEEFKLEFPHFEFAFADALEGEWVNVVGRSYEGACTLIMNIDQYPRAFCSIENVVELSSNCVDKVFMEKYEDLGIQSSFHSIIQEMKEWPSDLRDVKPDARDPSFRDEDVVNFDTTALIAIVSGISNGGAEGVLAKPESELRQRFKINTEFVIGQASSEITSPINAELRFALSSKGGMACESVHSEFLELVSMCGGPNEQIRADLLMKRLMIVPDSPSPRMMSLPTTRKLSLKNKVAFGTGDYWGAPTLTANMGFVRAISQTGMSLLTIEHRPRALIGD